MIARLDTKNHSTANAQINTNHGLDPTAEESNHGLDPTAEESSQRAWKLKRLAPLCHFQVPGQAATASGDPACRQPTGDVALMAIEVECQGVLNSAANDDK